MLFASGHAHAAVAGLGVDRGRRTSPVRCYCLGVDVSMPAPSMAAIRCTHGFRALSITGSGFAPEARPAAASQAHQRCHAPWLGPVGEVCAPWSAAHGQQGIRHLFAGKRSAISRSSPQPGRLLKRLVHSSRWIRARVDSLAETAWLRWASGAASPDSRKLCNTSLICNTQPRVRISPLCATPLGELSAMAIQEEA